MLSTSRHSLGSRLAQFQALRVALPNSLGRCSRPKAHGSARARSHATAAGAALFTSISDSLLYCGAFPSKAIGVLLSRCRRIRQPQSRDAPVAFSAKGGRRRVLISELPLVKRPPAMPQVCFSVRRLGKAVPLLSHAACAERGTRPALHASAVSSGGDPRSRAQYIAAVTRESTARALLWDQ